MALFVAHSLVAHFVAHSLVAHFVADSLLLLIALQTCGQHGIQGHSVKVKSHWPFDRWTDSHRPI